MTRPPEPHQDADAPTPRRRASRRDTRAPFDDALRIAIETLSAEICWFVANDVDARGAFVAATTDPTSRRPKS